MTLSKRAKFWLSAVLTVTFPLWVIPACLAVIAVGFSALVWASVADMLDFFDDKGEAKP